MRVYPEQFADHLKAGLKPCYLIFGDEPLLKLEAVDAVRQVAANRASMNATASWWNRGWTGTRSTMPARP